MNSWDSGILTSPGKHSEWSLSLQEVINLKGKKYQTYDNMTEGLNYWPLKIHICVRTETLKLKLKDAIL